MHAAGTCLAGLDARRVCDALQVIGRRRRLGAKRGHKAQGFVDDGAAAHKVDLRAVERVHARRCGANALAMASAAAPAASARERGRRCKFSRVLFAHPFAGIPPSLGSVA
jgi:hypothetical protein